MTSGLTYVGEMSLTALCPSVVGAIAPALSSLQAKLTGLTNLAAKLTVTPPTITANLQQAAELVATLTLAAGVSPPSVNFQVQAIASQLALVEGYLQALLALQGVLGAEAFVFTYAGPGASFGAAIASGIGAGWPDGTPPAAQANALVLGTTSAAAWTALTAFFGGAA